MKTTQHNAGYRIERIYVVEQEYKVLPDEGLTEVADPADRVVNFGWDWRPVGPRVFEVIVEVSVDAIKDAPEQMSVRLAGVFAADEGELSISLVNFLKANAPAILFPFVREVISTMSGRGPHGAFHLHPLNVASLSADFDIGRTTGSAFLDAHPDIATNFGLEYRTDSASVTEG